MKKIFIVIQILAFIGFTGNIANGQIEITPMPAVTPEELVEKFVGEGIQYSNVQYTGADHASGIFTNGSSTNLGLDKGIFLTTGAGYIIPGPNQSPSAGADNGITYQWPPIWGPTYYDPAILDFDFIPDSDTLRLKYVFGSEEYNEWVGGSFNDIFFLNISGANPNGGQYENKNIAIVPGTSNTSIKINTVNNGYSPPGVVPTGPCTHCEYYDDNTGGLTLEYDGFTVVLIAWLLTVPCENYHAQFGVLDAGDGILDSGVFIEENSFSSPLKITTTTLLDPTGLTEDMVEGHVEADLVFKLPSDEYAPVTICFEITGTAINGIDYEEIDNCITFEEGQDSASFHVVPLYDGIIEGDETIILIIENTLGCEVVNDTVELIIKDYIPAYSVISPNTIVCGGQSVELWVEVNWGFPPYTYNWQPGSYTIDTIVVSPEETTTYTVTYSDIFGEAGIDSTTVFVFPDDQNDMIALSFEKEYNPDLPWDAIGEISEDSIIVAMPSGTAIDNLIASFAISNCATAFVGDEEQFSCVSSNDFTSPVIYQVIAANGELHDWLVVVEIETGIEEEIADELILLPNPSNGKFYLEISNTNFNQIELQVMDLTGRIVYEKKQALPETIEIDLSGQQKGMYFLSIKTEEENYTQKLIIQ